MRNLNDATVFIVVYFKEMLDLDLNQYKKN